MGWILRRTKEPRRKERPEEPIFTAKGVLLLAIYGAVYAAIIFSMDPEWVGWAGPMVFGALYVPNPPPPLFRDPRAALEMGSWMSLLALLALVLVSVIRGEKPLGFWRRLKAR